MVFHFKWNCTRKKLYLIGFTRRWADTIMSCENHFIVSEYEQYNPKVNVLGVYSLRQESSGRTFFEMSASTAFDILGMMNTTQNVTCHYKCRIVNTSGWIVAFRRTMRLLFVTPLIENLERGKGTDIVCITSIRHIRWFLAVSEDKSNMPVARSYIG